MKMPGWLDLSGEEWKSIWNAVFALKDVKYYEASPEGVRTVPTQPDNILQDELESFTVKHHELLWDSICSLERNISKFLVNPDKLLFEEASALLQKAFNYKEYKDGVPLYLELKDEGIFEFDDNKISLQDKHFVDLYSLRDILEVPSASVSEASSTMYEYVDEYDATYKCEILSRNSDTTVIRTETPTFDFIKKLKNSKVSMTTESFLGLFQEVKKALSETHHRKEYENIAKYLQPGKKFAKLSNLEFATEQERIFVEEIDFSDMQVGHDDLEANNFNEKVDDMKPTLVLNIEEVKKKFFLKSGQAKKSQFQTIQNRHNRDFSADLVKRFFQDIETLTCFGILRDFFLSRFFIEARVRATVVHLRTKFWLYTENLKDLQDNFDMFVHAEKYVNKLSEGIRDDDILFIKKKLHDVAMSFQVKVYENVIETYDYEDYEEEKSDLFKQYFKSARSDSSMNQSKLNESSTIMWEPGEFGFWEDFKRILDKIFKDYEVKRELFRPEPGTMAPPNGHLGLMSVNNQLSEDMKLLCARLYCLVTTDGREFLETYFRDKKFPGKKVLLEKVENIEPTLFDIFDIIGLYKYVEVSSGRNYIGWQRSVNEFKKNIKNFFQKLIHRFMHSLNKEIFDTIDKTKTFIDDLEIDSLSFLKVEVQRCLKLPVVGAEKLAGYLNEGIFFNIDVRDVRYICLLDIFRCGYYLRLSKVRQPDSSKLHYFFETLRATNPNDANSLSKKDILIQKNRYLRKSARNKHTYTDKITYHETQRGKLISSIIDRFIRKRIDSNKPEWFDGETIAMLVTICVRGYIGNMHSPRLKDLISNFLLTGDAKTGNYLLLYYTEDNVFRGSRWFASKGVPHIEMLDFCQYTDIDNKCYVLNVPDFRDTTKTFASLRLDGQKNNHYEIDDKDRKQRVDNAVLFKSFKYKQGEQPRDEQVIQDPQFNHNMWSNSNDTTHFTKNALRYTSPTDRQSTLQGISWRASTKFYANVNLVGSEWYFTFKNIIGAPDRNKRNKPFEVFKRHTKLFKVIFGENPKGYTSVVENLIQELSNNECDLQTLCGRIDDIKHRKRNLYLEKWQKNRSVYFPRFNCAVSVNEFYDIMERLAGTLPNTRQTFYQRFRKIWSQLKKVKRKEILKKVEVVVSLLPVEHEFFSFLLFLDFATSPEFENYQYRLNEKLGDLKLALQCRFRDRQWSTSNVGELHRKYNNFMYIRAPGFDPFVKVLNSYKKRWEKMDEVLNKQKKELGRQYLIPVPQFANLKNNICKLLNGLQILVNKKGSRKKVVYEVNVETTNYQNSVIDLISSQISLVKEFMSFTRASFLGDFYGARTKMTTIFLDNIVYPDGGSRPTILQSVKEIQQKIENEKSQLELAKTSKRINHRSSMSTLESDLQKLNKEISIIGKDIISFCKYLDELQQILEKLRDNDTLDISTILPENDLQDLEPVVSQGGSLESPAAQGGLQADESGSQGDEDSDSDPFNNPYNDQSFLREDDFGRGADDSGTGGDDIGKGGDDIGNGGHDIGEGNLGKSDSSSSSDSELENVLNDGIQAIQAIQYAGAGESKDAGGLTSGSPVGTGKSQDDAIVVGDLTSSSSGGTYGKSSTKGTRNPGSVFLGDSYGMSQHVDKLLPKYGIKRDKKTVANGNCFFDALRRTMGLRQSISQIRNNIVDHLIILAEDPNIQKLIEVPVDDQTQETASHGPFTSIRQGEYAATVRQTYYARMRRDGSEGYGVQWADQAILYAAASLYGRPIYIIKEEPVHPRVRLIRWGNYDRNNFIVLVDRPGVHFWGTKRLAGAKVENQKLLTLYFRDKMEWRLSQGISYLGPQPKQERAECGLYALNNLNVGTYEKADLEDISGVNQWWQTTHIMRALGANQAGARGEAEGGNNTKRLDTYTTLQKVRFESLELECLQAEGLMGMLFFFLPQHHGHWTAMRVETQYGKKVFTYSDSFRPGLNNTALTHTENSAERMFDYLTSSLQVTYESNRFNTFLMVFQTRKQKEKFKRRKNRVQLVGDGSSRNPILFDENQAKTRPPSRIDGPQKANSTGGPASPSSGFSSFIRPDDVLSSSSPPSFPSQPATTKLPTSPLKRMRLENASPKRKRDLTSRREKVEVPIKLIKNVISSLELMSLFRSNYKFDFQNKTYTNEFNEQKYFAEIQSNEKDRDGILDDVLSYLKEKFKIDIPRTIAEKILLFVCEVDKNEHHPWKKKPLNFKDVTCLFCNRKITDTIHKLNIDVSEEERQAIERLKG